MSEIKKAPEGAKAMNHLNDSTAKALLSILQRDKLHSRAYLSARLNISDRAVRKYIEFLRREGHPIVTDSDSRGYKLGTREEANIEARKFMHRANELIKTAKAMKGEIL